MTPSIIQIAVVTLIAFIYGAEKNAGQILTNMSVTPAWFVGLALGDPVTGLAVGAIVQLMSLGVAAMGGASVPDYPTAAIIGAVVAITSGQEASVGVAAGILPVVGLAMLLSFMPMKKFIAYAIVGFVLAAYLQISILPIALLGAAAAIEYYKSHSNPSVNALDAGGLEDE